MDFFQVELSFDYVNSGDEWMNSAYISKSTGRIYYHSEYGDNEEELPEGIEENEDYVKVPQRKDLNLGQALVWEFVRKEIPGLEERVREIFSRKGAYARFREFLEYNGIRHKWLAFEDARVQETLAEWCEENGIPLDDE